MTSIQIAFAINLLPSVTDIDDYLGMTILATV